jgi:nucleoside-diphosphate-sugar epimerase
MKYLVIIGANGWLGKAVCSYAFSHFPKYFSSVILCDRLFDTSLHYIDSAKYLECDICDQQWGQHIRDLIPSGAEVSVVYTASVIHAKNARHFYQVNVSGLDNVLKGLKGITLERFTYVSSNSVLGINNSSPAFDEYSSYSPLGNYGRSKMLAELLLFRNLPIEQIKIIRAPWFHGLNMPERQKMFIRQAASRTFPIIWPGNNRRSIINVDDLSIAALNLTFKPSRYSVYWISEPVITLKDMIYCISGAAMDSGLVSKQTSRKRLFYLPPLTSLFFLAIDLIIQRFGLYSKVIHVLGELGMNIHGSSLRYTIEFPEHKFTSLEKSIYTELSEAFGDSQ